MKAARYVLGVIIALAALLRLLHLGSKSIWQDEAASIVLAKMEWPAFWHMITVWEANMAFYYLLLRPWILISDSEAFVRLLSVLFAVATVPVIYLLGKELFSRRAGMIAALLLAVNAVHVEYSQQARSYTLVVFSIACSSLLLLRNLNEGRRMQGFWYVLASVTALYAHFFAALVLLAQLTSLGFAPAPRARLRKQFSFVVLSLLLGLPQLLFMLRNRNHQLTWVQHPSARDVYHFSLHLTGSGLSFAIYLAAFALVFREFLLRRRRQAANAGTREKTWGFSFLVVWLILPVAIALLASHWKPVFVPRFLLVCLPASVLLGAEGLASIATSWVRNSAIALLAIASVMGVRSYYRHPPVQDWRAAVSYVEQGASAGDTVLLAFAHYRMPFDYYRAQLPNAPPVKIIVPPAPVGGDSQHVWLILCDPINPPVTAAMTQLSSSYREQREADFQGIKLMEFTAPNPSRAEH